MQIQLIEKSIGINDDSIHIVVTTRFPPSYPFFIVPYLDLSCLYITIIISNTGSETSSVPEPAEDYFPSIETTFDFVNGETILNRLTIPDMWKNI